MSWLAYDSNGGGVGCDERPAAVVEVFDACVGMWAELHDRGKPMFVDPRAVYWIAPDNEEVEKDTNKEFAAAEAEREGKAIEERHAG